jgi:hypothetical protein
MSEVKCSNSVRLCGFVKEFGKKYFTADGIILFCKLCEMKVTAEKRFTVQQHCNTAKQHCNAAKQHCNAAKQHCNASKHCNAAKKHCNAAKHHYNTAKQHVHVI